MKQSVKRLFSSVLALLFIVAAFVTFLNFVEPQYEQVSQLKGQVLSQGQLVDQEKAVINEVKKLVDSYNQSQELRDSVSSALPPTPNLAEALAQLNGLANLSHLTAQAYALSTPTTIVSETARRNPDKTSSQALVQPLSFVIFQVKLLGSYEDFKSFLRTLESNMRVMDIRSVTLQLATPPLPGKPAVNLFQYDLTVATYYQISANQ